MSESNRDRDVRQARQAVDAKASQDVQNKANEQTWNNSGLLRDIQARQCDVLVAVQKLSDIVDNIDKHTTVMNEELGACEIELKTHTEKIASLEHKMVHISWKELGTIIGGVSILVGIIIPILQMVLK